MPPSLDGPVLFLGSGPYRISQEIRGNVFAPSCLAYLRENSIPFVVMDNDAAGPLLWEEGLERLIRAPFDAEGIAAALAEARPSRVIASAAGKEVQALLVEGLERWGREDALPGIEAYRAAADWRRFRDLAASVGVEVPFGQVVTSIEDAASVAGKVGFPLFLSTSRSVGGGGARIVYNYEDLAAQVSMLLSWSLAREVLAVRVHEKHGQCEVHVMRDERGGIRVLGVSDTLSPLGIHVANVTNVFPARGLAAATAEAVEKAASALAEAAGVVGSAVFHFGIDREGRSYAVGMRAGLTASTYLVSLGLSLDVARAATALAFGKTVTSVVKPSRHVRTAVSSPRFENRLFPGSGDSIGAHKISSGAGIGIADQFAPAFLAAVASARAGREGLFPTAYAIAAEGNVLPHLAAPRTEFLADLIGGIVKGHALEEIGAASGASKTYLEQLAGLAFSWEDGHRATAPRKGRAAKCGWEHEVIHHGERSGKALVVFGPPARGIGEVDESDAVLRGISKAYLAKGYRLVFGCWQSRMPLDLFFLASEIHPLCARETAAAVLKSKDTALVYVDPRRSDCDALMRQALAAGARLVGVAPDKADVIYDRKALAGILPRVGLVLKEGEEVADAEQAKRAAAVHGYPILLKHRGGEPKAFVAHDEAQLEAFVSQAGGNVVVERFLEDLVETAVLVLGDGAKARAVTSVEILEEAGISNIDRASVLPPFSINERTRETIVSRAEALVAALALEGLVTVRIGVRYGVTYFLSATLGASREVPFAALAIGRDVVAAAADIFDGAPLDEVWRGGAVTPARVFVRQPVFSFGRFPGSDTVLGTRPRSTGDVIGEGANFALAYAEARRAARRPLPLEGTAFVSLRDRDKRAGILVGRQLEDIGFHIVATEGTAKALEAGGVKARVVYRVSEGRPNVIDLLKNREINLVIYTPSGSAPREDEVSIRTIAWSLGIPVITTAGEALAAVGAIEALKGK